MRERTHKRIIILLRLFFGILLVAASINKILHPVAFAGMVENYRVITIGPARWVAVWLPYLEAITGLLLITGVWIKTAAMINATLMTAFLILIGQAWIRGLDINCGCFRIDEPTVIDVWKLVQNGVFLAGSAMLVKLVFGLKRTDSSQSDH